MQEEATSIVKQKNLGDPIEPMLFLQIKLRELLDLPIATTGMNHPGMAYISEDELNSIGCAILDQSSTPEQQKKILCESLGEISYSTDGKPIAFGNISATNPFQLPIDDVWRKALVEKYSDEFKAIEPPLSDEELNRYFSVEQWQRYNQTPSEKKEGLIQEIHAEKIKALVVKITKDIL